MLRRIHVGFLALLLLAGAVVAVSAQTTPEPVDINSASVQQITEIVGDETLAQRIVQGRPYANKRQILTRGLVSMEEYNAISERIVARRLPDPQTDSR